MIDPEIEKIGKDAKERRATNLVLRVGIVVMMVAVVALAAVLATRDHFRGQAVQDLSAALNTANQQILECSDNPTRAECSEPVAPPAQEVIDAVPGPVDVQAPAGPQGPRGRVGQTGDQGEQGAPGPAPTQAQVDRAVRRLCADGSCDPDDPTQAQVNEALTTFCNANAECVGDPGRPGQNGEDGGDGQDGATGPAGPPPTQTQILSSVETYCLSLSGGTCKGDRGPEGPEGDEGPAGRGIIDVTCVGLGTQEFTLNYSDGTSQTFTC